MTDLSLVIYLAKTMFNTYGKIWLHKKTIGYRPRPACEKGPEPNYLFIYLKTPKNAIRPGYF